MRAERLFEALGLVDDRLVEEAADARRVATPWRRWAALAACLVLVIGVGSVSFGLLFRGCGSTADMNQSMDCAPAESEAACGDTGWSGGADGMAPVEEAPAAPQMPGPEDTPAGKDDFDASVLPEEAGSADAPTAVPGEPLERGAGPVLTLSAQGAGALRAERTLNVAVSADHADITDRYLVTNLSDQDVEASFAYPVAGSLASLEASGLTLTADGSVLNCETSFTPSRYVFAADGSNLAQADWAALSGRRGEAVSSLDLDQTVTLWEVRNVTWDGSAGGGLAVSFAKPAGTQVLYYGFSGHGVRDGLDYCEDEVTLDPGARRELVFLGEAPEAWTVRGFDLADRTRTDLTCEVSVRTLTLGGYLRTMTGSDLERDLLAELLAQDLTAAQGGDLRRLAYLDARAAHIFDHSFRLTIPAGETVEVTASFRQLGCWSEDYGVDWFAYEILCGDTGALRLTSQSAQVTLPPSLSCAESSLPLNQPAPMEAGARYRIVVQ